MSESDILKSFVSDASLVDSMKDSVFLVNGIDEENLKNSLAYQRETSETLCKNEDFQADVIIIAGLSGLMAAYSLKKQNKKLNILILEAKERVGGRTLTINMKCSEDNVIGKFDVGGAWVGE
jgi:hypothetical protein